MVDGGAHDELKQERRFRSRNPSRPWRHLQDRVVHYAPPAGSYDRFRPCPYVWLWRRHSDGQTHYGNTPKRSKSCRKGLKRKAGETRTFRIRRGVSAHDVREILATNVDRK